MDLRISLFTKNSGCLKNLCFFVLQSTVVMWKMKPPEKKALVKREDPNELRSKVRKGARKKNMEPVKALSEFQEIDSFC